jgi:hypothetical protein
MKPLTLKRTLNRSKLQQESGVLALLLFVPLCIISYSLLATVRTTHTLLEIKNITKKSAHIDNTIMRTLATPGSVSSGCHRISVPSKDDAGPTLISCTFIDTPFTTIPAIALPQGSPHYKEIFQNMGRCPGGLSDTAGPIFTTPKTTQTCLVDSYLIQESLTLPFNIEAANLTSETTKETGHIAIASTGSIEITDSLIANTPLLVLAGGDISVTTIATQANNVISVTLLSAHGDISVDHVGANIEIVLIGRKSLPSLPLQALTLPPNLPPFISKSVDGFVVE